MRNFGQQDDLEAILEQDSRDAQRKEKKRKEKKRKEKKRKDYAFQRQFNKKPSNIPGSQGDAQTLPSPSLDTEGCQACSQLPESGAACNTSGSGLVCFLKSSCCAAVLLRDIRRATA